MCMCVCVYVCVCVCAREGWGCAGYVAVLPVRVDAELNKLCGVRQAPLKHLGLVEILATVYVRVCVFQ